MKVMNNRKWMGNRMWSRIKGFRDRFQFDDRELPFLTHLEAFRKTLIRMVVSLVVGMLICLPVSDQLIRLLRAPAEPYIEASLVEALAENPVQLSMAGEEVRSAIESTNNVVVGATIQLPDERVNQGMIRLQFSEPAAALKMWLLVSFFGGLLLSLPFLVFFLALFVLPGVRDVEQRAIKRIAVFSGGLFLLGVVMGYKITLPLALGLMLKIGAQLGGESIWFYSKYIMFALQLLLAFGLAFQLPVAILILGKMGVVGSRQLREKRRHVIVGLLVLSMLLTPPDLLTQLLLAAPLILLYEFCIWFLHFTGNRDTASIEDKSEVV